MARIALALGTNQSNRIATLKQAVKHLQEIIKIKSLSLIYETPALLPENAPASWNMPYLNMALTATTELEPVELLKRCKSIESKMGRHATARWAPRIIDIDILLYDQIKLSTEQLTIPHPEMHKRAFVLLPLAEIAADWALPAGVSNQHGQTVNCVRELAQAVTTNEQFTHCLPSTSTLVGVLNVSPDSFSEVPAYLEPSQYLTRLQKLFAAGAEVIDIGAESTRPGAKPLSSAEEISRLKGILDLYQDWRSSSAIYPLISLDSYHPQTIEWAIHNYDIDWVNNVALSVNEHLFDLVKGSKRKLVIMHSLTIPANSNVHLPISSNCIDTVCRELAQTCEHALRQGLSPEQIIIDPGLGFGKTSLHSIELLRHTSQLKKLGFEVLVGTSRKSLINLISQEAAAERDLETSGLLSALIGQADYFRVHNVDLNRRVLAAAEFAQNKSWQ
jgi:2-amino-4-hydroxy-6-hydroxymethyldihydropteridine diphosphokinase/dihydropteroate synthase